MMYLILLSLIAVNASSKVVINRKEKTISAIDFSLPTVKPVFSDHIKQDIILAFQTGGCLLLHECSAESSCMSFLHYFHSAISNHLSIAMSMSPEWTVA